MPRESRPPDFDMTYVPERRSSFGPPWKSWVLPVLYLVVSMLFLAVVTQAHATISDSPIHRYIVEQDSRRVVGSQTLAWLFFLGGVASMVRAAMRGVVISRYGVEAREVFALGLPRVHRYSWQEIQAVIVESKAVGLELWSGEQVWLPQVANLEGLRDLLTRAAEARHLVVKVRETISEVESPEDG